MQTQHMSTTASNIEWETVMGPIRTNPRIREIRAAAEQALVRDMNAAGDYDSGISSSDINHTIFGVAVYLLRQLNRMPTASQLIDTLRSW